MVLIQVFNQSSAKIDQVLAPVILAGGIGQIGQQREIEVWVAVGQ